MKNENLLLVLFLFFIWVGREASKTTQGSTDPQIIRETSLPKYLLNSYRKGDSLVSVERLFQILAPRKEKAFCRRTVFFLGKLTSILVLRRLREEHALSLLKSSQRYFGARFLRDLKVTIFDGLLINSCTVFHPTLSNIGLIFVTVLAALFWGFCSC